MSTLPLLREKLDFFYEELAKTTDAPQNFALKKRIEETQASIAGLEGRPAVGTEPPPADEPGVAHRLLGDLLPWSPPLIHRQKGRDPVGPL